jgi:hypothetical protein
MGSCTECARLLADYARWQGVYFAALTAIHEEKEGSSGSKSISLEIFAEEAASEMEFARLRFETHLQAHQ